MEILRCYRIAHRGGPDLVGLAVDSATANATDEAQLLFRRVFWLQTSAWVGGVLFVVFAYPSLAVMIKRRHDRNSAGRDAMGYMAFIAAEYLVFIAASLGAVPIVFMETATVPQLGLFGVVLGTIHVIFTIYMFVVLGILGNSSVNDRFDDLATPQGSP